MDRILIARRLFLKLESIVDNVFLHGSSDSGLGISRHVGTGGLNITDGEIESLLLPDELLEIERESLDLLDLLLAKFIRESRSADRSGESELATIGKLGSTGNLHVLRGCTEILLAQLDVKVKIFDLALERSKREVESVEGSLNLGFDVGEGHEDLLITKVHQALHEV